jgi:hypothetical protein
MDISGKLKTPASLHREKRLWYSLIRCLRRPPIWTLRRRKKIVYFSWESNKVPPKSNRHRVILLTTLFWLQYKVKFMLPSSSLACVHYYRFRPATFPSIKPKACTSNMVVVLNKTYRILLGSSNGLFITAKKPKDNRPIALRVVVIVFSIPQKGTVPKHVQS